MLQTILQIVLLFIFINFAILLGGLEGWLGWNLGHLTSFLWAFGKVFVFLGLGAVIMKIARLEEASLLLAGLIFGILIIFGNNYYGNFQKAFYQKQNIGGALEIKASDLGKAKDFYRTPYLKITQSGLGELKTFKRNVGKPDMPNVINYCYAEILNTKQSAVVIDYCSNEKKKSLLTLNSLQRQEEIIVELLPRRVYYSEIKGLQFTTTQKTFTDYYQKQLYKFWGFVKIINLIGLVFTAIYLWYRYKS